MRLSCKRTHFTLPPQFASLSPPFSQRIDERRPGSPATRSHGDVPINGRHVQTEQPELTFRTLACLPVSLRELVRWLKNATTAGVRADKGHTGRSLFGLAPVHTLVLQEKKKSLEKRGGVLAGLCSGNTAETKSMGGISPARPQETWQKHQDKP